MAREREAAQEKNKKSIGKTNLLEKMGMVDFHMKAVPGTEVPGHKVSLFWSPDQAKNLILGPPDSVSCLKQLLLNILVDSTLNIVFYGF